MGSNLVDGYSHGYQAAFRPRRLLGAWVFGAGVALLLVLLAPSSAASAASSWVSVDYGALVDRRQLTHSGQSVGALLDGLRGADEGAKESSRGIALRLLDPLLEPYAFVLPDALDALEGRPERPMVEIGWLYEPTTPAPTWVELLRSRSMVIESDGAGRLRAFLPWPAGGARGSSPPALSTDAGEQAWESAWPVVRFVIAGELLRQKQAGGGAGLDIRVFPFLHRRESSTFRLGTEPYIVRLEEVPANSPRPPLDLAGLKRFIDSGMQLEGAKLVDGQLLLMGSRPEHPVSILSGPVTLADYATAFRAIFHGGLGEPYMSLDRGASPHRLTVNYGGRLADTRLGLVSLLCDARFKTFSMGFDPLRHTDLREAVRESVPEFRTHVERFARDPRSGGLSGQQTRLWFYPDTVDLTISPQGDVLAMRRVRMSAAAQRVEQGRWTASKREDPPWTRDLTEEINRDYDRLAGRFPELGDLDQVARLLALFSWLGYLDREGALLPDLDRLLAVELPAFATPGTFPQMLAAAAIPAPGAKGAINVYPRFDVARGMDRLLPVGGRRLDAPTRFRLARAALDPRNPSQSGLARRLAQVNPETLEPWEADSLAYQAERLRTHRLVLGSLSQQTKQDLRRRSESGERLRVFSVGIGGLDLGLSGAVAKAKAASLRLGGGQGFSVARSIGDARRAEGKRSRSAARPAPVPKRWAAAPAVESPALPEHGLGSAREGDRVLMTPPEPNGGRPGLEQVLLRAASPFVRGHTTEFDHSGRVLAVRRVEGSRVLRYRLVRTRDGLLARPLPSSRSGSATAAGQGKAVDAASLPAKLAFMGKVEGKSRPTGTPSIWEISREGRPSARLALPPPAAERLLLGRELDLTPGAPLPGVEPPDGVFDGAESVLVALSPERAEAPWEGAPAVVDPRRDPLRIAPALDRWWSRSGADRPGVALAVDGGESVTRWKQAPRRFPRSLLLLDGPSLRGESALGRSLAAAWDGPVAPALPRGKLPPLVVVVSDRSPAVLWEMVGRMSRSPQLEGRLLAVFSLSGAPRPDQPPAWVASGKIAGLGIAWRYPLDEAGIAREIEEFAAGLKAKGEWPIEARPGPFDWLF